MTTSVEIEALVAFLDAELGTHQPGCDTRVLGPRHPCDCTTDPSRSERALLHRLTDLWHDAERSVDPFLVGEIHTQLLALAAPLRDRLPECVA